MNNSNLEESQLRSWNLRQPSPALKKRIFAEGPQRESAMALIVGASWRWMAPAMGSFLLILILSGPRQNEMAYFASGTNHLLSLTENSSSRAAFMAENFHTIQNLADRGSFEWSNSSSSSTPLTLPASAPNTQTNTLIP